MTGPICPLKPGYSISHEASTDGTFGCVVRDLKDGEILLLSNNHVLALTNNAKEGDIIMHPGPFYKHLGPLPVATLKKYREIIFGGNEESPDDQKNRIDAAVARPMVPIDPYIPSIGIPKGIHMIDIENPPVINPLNEIRVKMVAEVSNYQEGRITNWTGEGLFPNFDQTGKDAYFHHIIECDLLNQSGDSGALVLDSEGNALGLLFFWE